MQMMNRRWIGLGISALWAFSPAAWGACVIGKIAEFEVSDAGNQPLVDGQINGQPVKVLIDTGSTMSFLGEAQAKRLGLKLEGVDRMRVWGVGGEKRLFATRISRLQIGNFAGKDQLVAVVGSHREADGGGPDFVLGEDVLARFTVELDLAHHVVRLLRPEGCKPEQLVYWSKSYSMAELNGQNDPFAPKIAMTVMLQGTKVNALLDTGAAVSWATVVTARRAGVTRTDDATAQPAALTGANGQPIETWLGTFAAFSIGDDETIHNVKLRIGNLFGTNRQEQTGSHIPQALAGSPEMLIGYDFLMAHRVVVLLNERKLFLTYNGGQVFQAHAPH
jgi:clan AA aspartic protease (TIGR02281 family)